MPLQRSTIIFKMATSKSGKSSKRTLSLEASLENLRNVASSLKKDRSPKRGNFFFSYDGSGKRVRSVSKPYRYRSVAERAARKGTRPGAVSSRTVNNTELSGEEYEGDTAHPGNGFDSDINDVDEDTFDDMPLTEDLASCIKNCEKITKEMSNNTQSAWTRRMQAVEAKWENSRASIFTALLKSYAIPSSETLCFICRNEHAVIRCRHCGPAALICSSCDETVHNKNPLHDRDIWSNGFFQPVPPTITLLGNGSLECIRKCAPFLLCEECVYCQEHGTLSLIPSDETCIIVTSNGRFDLNLCSYHCTGCGGHFSPLTLEKIINEGYWPGSPENLNYVFSEDVFRLWDSIRKHMPGTSEAAFIKSLGCISSEKGRSSIINSMVFHRAFKEWCFALHEIEVLQGKSWIDCPSCFGSQHSCHVDGNAKLYRYRCVPRGERKCYYGDLFIENDEKVNAHLTSIYSHASAKNHSSNTYCGTSNWKAARNTACRRSKLDETGLSVAGCRHAVAQAAVNMHQGELYGYTHYLQINRLVPQHVKFLWQDVVCKYWPWFTSLPKELSPPEAFLMKPALSIMHGKAHIWSCQVTWGGRWQTGSGYTAGEEVEQINSYISRLGSTTKYMHAAGRNEALTEHVLHWNKLKVLKLPTSLCKKYVSVKKLIEQNKEELNKLMEEVNVTNYVENNILEIWAAEIMACGRRTLSGKSELTKRQKDLITFCQLNTEIREAAALKPFVEESSDGVGMAIGNSDLYDQALGKQQDIEQKKRKLETLGSSLGVVECDSEKVKALEEGKKLLASKKRVAIREEIEMLCFSILQRKKNISRLADSSKQRSKLRSKNVNEKKKLEDSVKQYNVINRMLENANVVVADLTSEQVLDGNYPWIDPQDNKAALPLRAKRKPAEVYLTGKRLQEEVKLLEEEMRRFLCYYRDNIMPNLSARLNFIERDELFDEHVEEDIQQIEEGKYKANFSRLALAGEVALLKSGMFFCKGVIKEAITILKPVIEGTMDVDDFFDSGDEENEENLDEEDEEWEDE